VLFLPLNVALKLHNSNAPSSKDVWILDWSGENEFRFKVGEGLGCRVGEVGRRGKLCGR